MPLDDALDLQTVARLAGPRSLARGQAYAEEGAVRRLEVAHERVAATVDGTRPYRVRLGVEKGHVAFACSCPVGEEGDFCKHCVAVAIRWLEDGAPGGPDPAAVGDHLRSLGVEPLVQLLLEHAREDERLAKRLETMALRASGGPVDVAAYRSLVDRATAVHGYVGYREAWAFFSGVDEALDALDGLLGDGHAQEVVELAEHALRALDATCGYVEPAGGPSAAGRRMGAARPLDARRDLPVGGQRRRRVGARPGWRMHCGAVAPARGGLLMTIILVMSETLPLSSVKAQKRAAPAAHG